MDLRHAAVVASLAMLAACSSSSPVPSPTGDGPTALSRSFLHAATHASVPRDLLVAIANVEQGLDLPAQRLDLEADSAVPAAGPLMLRRGKLDTLARGAALSGTSELALRQDADLALEAGALVLAELGDRTGARADDLASWKTAIEELSGYADAAHREEYAHRVFAALARGGRFPARDGETIDLPAHDLPPTLTLDLSSQLHTLATAQYPGAQFFPTSCVDKCTLGRAGNAVKYIVIHDTEGGWDASVATLQNDPGKSVQYIVGTDGRVGQFVTEDTTAYHAGNFFYNQRSVGIEHVGYSKKPFAEAEYAASAKLVDYLAKKYAVARDRAHIIGHDQIPNGSRISESDAACASSPATCEGNVNYGGASHHTDPGVWEWATFMKRLGAAAKCNDVTDLWNCSSDGTQAFRCAGAKVTVELCDGPGACETKPNGQDDLCHVKPATTPPTPPATPSEPAAAPDEPTTPTETTGAAVPSPDGGQTTSIDAGSGCTTSPRGRNEGLAPALLLLVSALVVVRRRRAA